MPLGISLKDRNVEVPLVDWGSGTQNRTHILMALLQANRIKTTGPVTDRITPLVVIEEPECFLHPSAQAEFGRILRHLSDELGIQIVVTTHSPHMLNQEDAGANILLARRMRRKKSFETVRIDTTGAEWMAPFADHLGIASAEFANLRPLFLAEKSSVLLVEGTIDQAYFEHLKNHSMDCTMLEKGVQVVPYGGKDTLKNTLLVQFVLKTFDRVFITYDLDAQNDVRGALNRLQLKEGTDFLPLGISHPGRDCIEGLLPEPVLAAVNGCHTDLVMKLGSSDPGIRRAAKENLKHQYLAEFIRRTDFSKDELKHLDKAIRTINKAMGTEHRA